MYQKRLLTISAAVMSFFIMSTWIHAQSLDLDKTTGHTVILPSEKKETQQSESHRSYKAIQSLKNEQSIAGPDQTLIVDPFTKLPFKKNQTTKPDLQRSKNNWNETLYDFSSESVIRNPIYKSLNGAGNVLWDTSHGVFFDYKPSGDYSSLAAMLSSKGFTIDENSQGVLNVNLDAYDILVVCLGSAWNSSYTAAEVAVIKNFVQQGGGLLVMGDNTSCPNENINPVAQAFGSTCGVSHISPDDVYVTDFALHPVFNGVSELFMRAAGEVEATSPSTEIAWYNSYGLVSCAEVGSGRVIVMSENNIWDDEYYSERDNELFASNVFNWLKPEPEPEPAGNVLWDTSHGVFLDYKPSGRYSSLAAMLTSQGFTIDENNQGVLNVNLSAYDIIVVCLGSAWNSSYTAAEVTAIKNFVQQGGGLLVTGDNTSCPNENINPVAQAFGSTCGVSHISPDDVYVTDFALHPVFYGVSELFMRAAGELEATSPSTEIAWYNSYGLVSCAEVGSGRVIVTSENNIWDDEYYSESDNELFALNVFNWLKPEPVGDVLWDTSHGVFLNYKPSGDYSSLVAMLTSNRFKIEENNQGVLNVNLNAYDILVVCLGSAWDSSYTAAEVTAIKNFVQQGGGLLIMGDNTDCPVGNINPVAQAFGATCGASDISPYDAYVTDFALHPVFNGISELYMRFAGEVEAVSPSTEIAWYNSDGLVSCAEVGSGRVIVTGDINLWDDEYYGDKDNELFALNVFNWLKPEPVGDVLWDTSHGVFLNYKPSGDYSSLAAMLTNQGFTIDENSQGVLNVNLNTYDIIVVCLGSAWDSSYTAAEVTAIKNFVQLGGGLLVMGDNTSCPNENINPVAQVFGSTCGISHISPDDVYVTDFALHPVFNGISELYLRAAGEVEATSPSTEIAWYNSYGLVSNAEVGSGRVIVIGDMNIWDDEYYGDSDNELFAENVFDWISL